MFFYRRKFGSFFVEFVYSGVEFRFCFCQFYFFGGYYFGYFVIDFYCYDLFIQIFSCRRGIGYFGWVKFRVGNVFFFDFLYDMNLLNIKFYYVIFMFIVNICYLL